MPGVLAVITAADLDLADLGALMPMFNAAMTRPLLARDTVRFVGEPIVAIVTETRAQGPDAAEAVFVDYEPLAALVDPGAATDDGIVLFAEAGTNVVWTLDHAGPPVDFSGCEVVVTQEMVNQRLAPSPIEGRSGAAWWDGGRLIQYQSCQGAHPVRDAIAEVYGLDQSEVRVVCPDVGGSFGAKAGSTPELLLLGDLSRRVGRPVRWVETRSENMVAMGHGRAQRQVATLGGTRDGRITAYKLTVVQDSGAYPSMGAVLPYMTRMMTTGVYEMGDVEFSATSVVTNTTPLVAYRGAGRPEAAACLERMIDRYATEIEHGPGRGAPPQPAGGRRLPGHHPDRHRVRQRRLRPRPRPVAGDGGLRRAAGRTGPPPGRRRPDPDGDRPGRLRRGHRRRSRVRRGPAAPRRHRAGQDRLQPLRPGPPHGLGHVGQRPPGHPHGSGRGHPRRHRRDPHRVGHGRVAIGAAGRRGGARRLGQAARRGPPAGRRPARGRPRGHRVGPRRGPLPRGRQPQHRPGLGGAGRRGRRPPGRPVGSGRRQGHLPLRGPPGGGGDRSRARRGAPGAAAWRSTTPA